MTFAHLGEALRTKALLRRVEAVVVEPGEELPEEPGLVFAVSPARRGFVLRDLGIALLPDTQVFRKRPPRADVRVGRALQSFADLRTGDYVVHEDHGVGQLLGFETKTVAAVTRDYLFLAFRGDDRLYVPHEQIAKVSRYVGADGHAPALSKLGGKAWQTIKSRARAARTSSRASCSPSTRSASGRRASPTRPTTSSSSSSRRASRSRRRQTSASPSRW